MIHRLSICLAAFALSFGLPLTTRAQTDGAATFQVTTVTAGGNYAPRNVMAIWVTDANTNFIKTLKRQAVSQIRWLTRWGTISKSNVVDGITGATLSSHQAHSVTWNCRNTNNVVVADGVYRVFVEFTEFNGAGPYIQATSFTKGSAGVTSAPTATANFTSMSLVYVPSVGPPALNPIGNKIVTVSNALQFAVTATATGGDAVTLTVSNKPATATFGATNVNGTFTWASPAPVGVYTMTFYAVDKDGAVAETVRVFVNPTGSVTAGLALGSPVITSDPANAADQNNVGDQYDLNPSGGFVSGTSQGGFGDIGRIHFNYDATNLYLGGTAASMGASSNAMIIFVDVNTRTENATDLWAKTGKPQGLDYLHNVAFSTPMDLAIVLGDEFGDGTFTDFNLGNGYNFGQGVFYLSNTTFAAVSGARLSQFDGLDPDATSAADGDGDRMTERWECAIPWTSLSATGIGSLTSIKVAGLLASSATNGVDRYLSGNFLGLAANPATNGNYGMSFVTLTGLDIGLAGGHDLAVTALGPGLGNPNTTSLVWVTVQNLQNSTETFTVVLSNVTAQAHIGSATVSNLAAGATTNVAMTWNTTGLVLGSYTLRATAGPLGLEVLTADNVLEVPFLVRLPFHEVAVTALTAPAFIRSGTTSNLLIAVQNLGDYAETFAVAVTDTTDRITIGSVNVTALPAYQTTNLTLAWNTAGRSTNYHELIARAAAVASETQADNNAASALTAVAPGVITSTWIAAGSTWKYRQDGLSMDATPWRQTNYYDGFWSEGPAALGFGNGGEATALSATQHVTYYFRKSFPAQHLPLSLSARVRADDGAVLYFNGTEVARDNLPAGTLASTTSATSVRSGTAETNWLSFTLATPNAMLGGNVAAVEVHQAFGSAAGSGDPWINELHYDNTSTDANEGVEVAGPAGLALTNFALVAYNGSDGLSYSNRTLSGTLPDQSNGYGTVWFAMPSLQNGPDAVALVKNGTNVLQFLSYEGSFTANNGPASGLTSTNLPVTEATGSSLGYSLQLKAGTGVTYSAFTWAGSSTNSRGALNAGQGIPPADAPDLAFDMEWQAVVPDIPARTNLVVAELTPSSDAVAGDVVSVAITVSNAGNTAMSYQLILINTNTQQLVASTNLTGLAAGTTQTIFVPWPTLGLATGSYTLAAYTVVNGVTNLLGGAQVSGVISGSGFGPAQVNTVGSVGGFADVIAVSGGFAYLGEGATLTVLDLSSPAVPVKRGSVRLSGSIRGLAVSGTHIYAACGAAGLHMIDAAQPDAPALVQSFNSSGYAQGVAVAGTTLALADGISGVRFFSIANPAAPTIAGAYATVGPAVSIALASSTAYVLDGFEGLHILNIANPAAPVLLGRSATLPNGVALALLGSQALVLDEQARLVALTISSPSTPVEAGRLQLPAPAYSIAAAGTHAYLGAGGAGVLVISLANPASPAVATTLDTTGTAAGLALGGTTAYVADGLAGVQVLSIANPAAPVLQYTLGTGLRARDTVILNQLALVAGGEEGVLIYSLTNVASPRLLGTIATPNARRVALAGTNVCIAHGFGQISLASVADPANPVILGTYSNSALVSVHALAVSGTKLALADGRAVRLLDIANPAAPTLLASANAAGYAHDVAWCGSNLVVADGPAGVTILNGSTLAGAGSYNTDGRALAVQCSGSYAFVADGDSGWLTLDLANPGAPVVVSANAATPVVGLALQGSLLYSAGGHGAVQTRDISAPLTPVSAEQYESLTRALRMTAAPQGVFVAEDDAGLAILNAGAADADGDGLPDWWEQALVDANPSDHLNSILDVLPGGDDDQDGSSNRDEWLAGSAANDSDSLFVVESTAPSSSGFVVRWSSAIGHTYTLHQSTNLMSGFTVVQSGIPATYPANSYTSAVSGAGAYFMVTTYP